MVMILRYGGWLIVFNILFAIFVWLAMYFPGLDILASLAFVIILIWFSLSLGKMEMTSVQGYRLANSNKSIWQKKLSIIAICLIGQSPALITEGLAIWNWVNFGPFTSNYDFVLQMWHIPWMPLISVLPAWNVEGFVVSFLSLYLLSPVTILLMVILAFTKTRHGNEARGRFFCLKMRRGDK